MGTNFTQHSNCEAAYKFDDNFNDVSAIGSNHLSQSGTVSFSTTRPSGHTWGKSVQFDGSTNYLYRTRGNLSAGFPTMAAMEDASFATWFRVSTLVNDVAIFDINFILKVREDYGGGTGKGLTYIQYDTGWSAGSWQMYTGLTTNTWYHLVGKADGNGTSSTITMWLSSESDFGDIINGTQQTTDFDDVAQVGNDSGASSGFAIGANHDGTGKFTGYVYQPIIFENFLISAAQAEEIYTSGIDGSEGGATGYIFCPAP